MEFSFSLPLFGLDVIAVCVRCQPYGNRMEIGSIRAPCQTSKESNGAYARWSKQDLQANAAFMRAFGKELKDSDVFVTGEGLTFPDQARIVRAGSDGQPVTDGVFPESKEFLSGYWIVEVQSPEHAYQIAARIDGAWTKKKRGHMPIEVREVMSRAFEEWK